MSEALKQVIKRVEKGDQHAFSVLLKLYQHKVYRICYWMTGNHSEAEELAQETFLRAYLNIGSYDNNKNFSLWLFRITTNLTIKRLGKKKSNNNLDDELLQDLVVSWELQEMVQEKIGLLTPKDRLAIVLVYIEELSLKEVGEIMQISLSTVKTRIHRGREMLRKQANLYLY